MCYILEYKICYDVKTDVHNIYVKAKDPTPEALYIYDRVGLAQSVACPPLAR